MVDPFSPQAVTGLNPGSAPATSAMAGGMLPAIKSSAGPSDVESASLWSPDHPLFWVGAFVLVTYGLIGVNSSARIGKFKAGISAGKA